MNTKKSDKEGLLKLSLTGFIMTAFSESQCDGFCNIKTDRQKKSQAS
jgi:hypothetical protein